MIVQIRVNVHGLLLHAFTALPAQLRQLLAATLLRIGALRYFHQVSGAQPFRVRCFHLIGV